MTTTALESVDDHDGESRVPANQDRWELIPIGRDSWRLGDRSKRDGDAAHVIAFVERTELGRLEVLWLRSPCPYQSRFVDFAALFAALEDAVAAASVRSEAPRRIPHLPPL